MIIDSILPWTELELTAFAFHTSYLETESAVSSLYHQADFDLIFSYLKVRTISGLLLLFINKAGISQRQRKKSKLIGILRTQIAHEM